MSVRFLARSLAGLLPALAVLALALPDPAAAQTRFSVSGGALVPLGDLDDLAEPSPRFGIRAEYQPVNALGQRRLLAFTAAADFALLSVEDEIADVLSASGASDDASLLDLSVGVRAYSRVAPFFVSGGAGWSRFRFSDDDAENGLGLRGGLGFLAPLGAVVLEVEASLHQVFLDTEDLQFVAASAGLALPF